MLSHMNQRPVIAIGNFDGVHLGHRAIIAKARELAHGAPVVAVTFEPHPATILRSGVELPRLSDPAEREWLLLRAGVDRVATLPVDRGLLSMLPEEFIAWLIDKHIQQMPAAFVEGPDFRFGKGRLGDAALLEKIGQQSGFATHVVGAVQMAMIDQTVAPVSSSFVRWLVGNGRVFDAARCLGRAFALEGVVVRGDQRGRTIGVPTINLDDEALAGRQLPADGVYAGWAEVEPIANESSPLHAAAISIGVKPTFAGKRRVVEAHLLGFSGDLYGKRARLHLLRWVREQRPFAGVEHLKSQIHRDIAQVRTWRDGGFLDESAVLRHWINRPATHQQINTERDQPRALGGGVKHV
jgi:riboflavin kinase/FMN adenylyltransferase